MSLVNEIDTNQSFSYAYLSFHLKTDDFIVDNAVICTCDSKGEAYDLTEEQINEILELLA